LYKWNSACYLQPQKLTFETTFVAINFSDKVLITNPTSYHLGRTVICAGILVVLVGVITHFIGEDVLLPSMAWCAIGAPTIIIGVVFRQSGLTRN
jgi:hypothetical protein